MKRLEPEDNLERSMTECEITPKYDFITFQFYLYTDSFEIRNYELKGFDYKFHKIKDSGKPYLPKWSIDKYENQQTGNLVYYMMSSRIFSGYGKKYMVKISFHSEACSLTSTEISKFLNNVIKHYKNFINPFKRVDDNRILIVPKPVLSEVEIALDFRGSYSSTTFLLEHFSNNLYRLRSRKRRTVIDEETLKKRYTFDGRVLYSIYPTNYISDCFREYNYDEADGEEVFQVYRDEKAYQVYRCEFILTNSYLERKNIQSIDDLETFDKARYWTDHYFFFKFDRERILETVRKKQSNLLRIIAMLLENSLMTPFEILDRLKQYRLSGGERLFPYPSRLLKSKWHLLDEMIQKAISNLSLSEHSKNKPFQVIQRKRDRLPQKKGRKGKEAIVQNVINALRQKGKRVTYKAIEAEAGISQKTIARYKHLLKA